MKLTDEQISAVKCALADLTGSLQCYLQDDFWSHDWTGHRASIVELAAAFSEYLAPDFEDGCTTIELDEGYSLRLKRISPTEMQVDSIYRPDWSALTQPERGEVFPLEEGEDAYGLLEWANGFVAEDRYNLGY